MTLIDTGYEWGFLLRFLNMDVVSPLRLSAAPQHSCQRLDDRSGYPQIAGQLLCEPLQGALSTSGKNVCFPFPL